MILAVKQYKWFFIGTLALAALAMFAFQPASAATTDNLSGFAWSETIGWISFNDTDPPTGGAGYGVKVSSTGVISGYAWANPEDTNAGAMLSPWMATNSITKTDNIGWLSFNSIDTSTCPTAPNCQAALNKSTGQVTGWARFILGSELPNGGWVRLRGTATTGAVYGVSVSACQWSGYAWSDDFGWINFMDSATNGSPYGIVGTGDACVAPYNYSIAAPTAITVVKAASGSITEPLPVTITKTSGSTNEVVTITSITVSPASSAINPSWAGASCTPISGTPCVTTGLIDIESGATAGTYTLTTNTRSATGILKSDTTTLTVQDAPTFDFSLSRNPISIPYTAPATKYSDITVTRTAGTAASVNLSATVTNSSGATVSTITTAFSPSTSCIPSTGSCVLRMNVTVPSGMPDGPYTVNVRGVNGSTIRNTTVQLCVNFCSTFNYTVDAPNAETTVTRPSSGSITQNIPILITRTAGTSEDVRITSVTFADNTSLPSSISASALIGQLCRPSPTCQIARVLTITSAAPVGTHTLRVNTQAAGGRTANDTFILTIDNPPAPGVNFTVVPSTPATVTSYGGTSVRSNVVITWLSPLSAVERVRMVSVTFPTSPIASAGINADYDSTVSCLPSGNPLRCTRPLDLTVGAIVPDGTYTGQVCVRSIGNSAAGIASTNTHKCGNFTITVDVNGPLAMLDGRKTPKPTDPPTAYNYVNGPITVPSGSTVDLTWGSVDAESCQLSSDGVDFGTPGNSGTYVTGALTTDTTFTLTCDNANTLISGNPAIDKFVVNISATPPDPISVSLQGRPRSSGIYTDGPVRIIVGTGADLRWTVRNVTTGTTDITATCVLDSSSGSTWSKNTVRTHSFSAITVDRTYTITCTSASGGASVSDTIDVDVYTDVDLDGPGSVDQGEDFDLDVNYDGPTTGASCTLTGGGVNQTFDPNVPGNDTIGVTAPSSGPSVTYTINCTAGSEETSDTHTLTLNTVQCFDNFNFVGGTTPTAAFILQDNNSQNTFSVDVVLSLNGFDPNNLNLSFDTDVIIGSDTAPMRIANQTTTPLGSGSFRITLTLDNSRTQPVGEFTMRLRAEDTVGSCADKILLIPAYLIDERESLGEQ
ncbi:MAG: hypothetical protein AAB343_01525 [Patescibacteria group bacterium]